MFSRAGTGFAATPDLPVTASVFGFRDLSGTLVCLRLETGFFDLVLLAGFLTDFLPAFFVAGFLLADFFAAFAVFPTCFTPCLLFFARFFTVDALAVRVRGGLRAFLALRFLTVF